jgi:hypothetical protein
MIFQYRGDTINAAGNLIDVSGSNDLQYSEAFGSWNFLGDISVVADQYKNPLDGTKTADVLHENNANAWHFVYSTSVLTAGQKYTVSFYTTKLNRHHAALYFEGGVKTAFWDLDNGTVGTIQGVDTVATITPIIGGWYRCSITAIATNNGGIYLMPGSADNTVVYQGLDQDSLAVYGAQVVDNTDGYIVGPGVYHATTATTKPRLDLAPTGNPPGIDSHLQDSGGNKLRARSFDGATQYYSRAHHDCMSAFTADFSLTIVLNKSTNSSTGFFGHGNVAFWKNWWGTSYNFYGSDGATAHADSQTNSEYGMYHILQVVRSNSIITVYLNGTSGIPVDFTGAIGANAATLYLGREIPGATFWDGSILYASLDNRALSVTELAKDREEINGYLSGPKQVNPAWTFTRTTAAKQTYSTGGIRDRAINHPRVGDGVLIEGQRSNYCQQSETPAAWAPIRASVTNTTSTTLPNGTASGFHVLHEDATAANTHYINAGNIVAAPPGIFTFSADVKAINRQWVALYMYDTAPTNMYATFNVSTGVVGADSGGIISKKMEPIGDGWWRCSFTATMAGNDVSYLLIVAEGSGDFTFNGLDQDSLFVTNMQGENNSFATSYCGPTLASYLTCTKDNLTIDPHTASTNQYILPTIFFPGGPSKLTIEFDAKCEFSSSVDASQMLFLSIGDAGATNYINIFTLTNGKVYFATNASSSSHDIYSAANPVVFSNLNHYKFFLDFADMSRSEAWINGSNAGMTYVNHTGTAVLYTSTIRIGQDHDTYQVSGMQIKNLRILPVEF